MRVGNEESSPLSLPLSFAPPLSFSLSLTTSLPFSPSLSILLPSPILNGIAPRLNLSPPPALSILLPAPIVNEIAPTPPPFNPSLFPAVSIHPLSKRSTYT